MLHLVMSPFNFGKAQAQSRSESKFGTHSHEEHNEGMWMEVDSMVALELHLNELKVAFNIGIIFSDINFFGGVKGFVSIQTFAF
jgi:hypothetical protein